jgi:hypothetical protein
MSGDNRVGVYRTNFENETSDYIRWSASAIVPPGFYLTIQKVRPDVAEAAFRPAAALINGF